MNNKIDHNTDNTNNIDPQLHQTLLQLKDIHLPEDSLTWPPAPGVIILCLIILLLFLLKLKTIVIKSYSYYHNRAKFLAFKELNHIQKKLNSSSITCLKATQDIATLLKKCAVTKYNQNNDQNINALSGEQWLKFLDSSGKTDQFSQGDGRILINTVYQSEQSLDNNAELYLKINNLINLTRNWIRINL